MASSQTATSMARGTTPRRAAQMAVYICVRLGICVLQALSLEMCQTVAFWLSLLFARVIGLRAKLVDENLRQAFGQATPEERRDLARRMWEHLFLLVAEVAHAPRKIHDTNWRDFIRLRDVAPLVRALLSERPLILVTGHFGNFEVGGYVLGILGFPTYAVARPLDNPYLDRFVSRFRGLTGQYIIPKKGGYEQIVRVLENRGTISFLADQYAGSKGCWVEFFGRPVSAHKAIALFALEHDALLEVVAARRLDKPLQFEFIIEDAADSRDDEAHVNGIRQLTQWYTSALERMIRRNPEQYWWLHRRWRDNRRAAKARRQAA